MYLHTVVTDKSVKSNIDGINFVRHNIVLVAVCGDDEININDLIVSMKLAEYDPQTAGNLQNIPRIIDVECYEEENWDAELDKNPDFRNDKAESLDTKPNDEDDISNWLKNFTEEEITEFITQALNLPEPNKQEDAKKLERIEENDVEMPVDQPKTSELTQSIDVGYVSDELNNNENSPKTSSKANESYSHPIEYLYKRPNVHWRQTEEKIMLRINAHENPKYGLDVTPESLIYG